MKPNRLTTAEELRLTQDTAREKNWKRWGPYLSERQWATVREDYSAWGNCWEYFPHDHVRSRAYRWARTACWASPIGSAGFALRWRFGTAKTRF
jgi:hypothetical protein